MCPMENERKPMPATQWTQPPAGSHKYIKEILVINYRAKLVIASGYAANAQVLASLDVGLAGYAAKPFCRVDLLNTVTCPSQ